MSWSIAEVARMSGVTSRTLRHYDAIGLLAPAGVADNGHRFYDQAGLLRLQEILVLRELGLGLRQIADVLDRQRSPLQALREHYDRLLRDGERLVRVAETVARTICELETQEGDSEMAKINRPENLFEGFDPSAYDEQARQRWPQEWEQSRQAVESLTPRDTERMQRETTAAMIRMAELMAGGTPAEDPTVQDEIDAAYQVVCRFWTPNAAAYRNLGQMYVDDPQFRATYDRVADGLAVYYRDAMAHYADARLT